LFDPAGRLQKGFFLATATACSSGAAQTLPFSTSLDLGSICNAPIGTVSSQITQLQQEYQAATKAAGAGTNPSYVGNTLTSGIDINTTSLLAPNYKSTRSVQMNIGIQREIRRGMVLTVDYLRNVSTHNLLSIDTNHVGDSRFFNATAAAAAVLTVETNCGNGLSLAATYSGAFCATDPANGTNDNNTYNTKANPARHATLADYSAKGLDSGYVVCGGGPCPNAAFGGVNMGATGANQMLFPIGRSVYNGLQMSLKDDVHNPFRGVKYMNLQVSYSFSKYVSTARDSDFINFPTDYANPLGAMGPNGLDRTHQLSFGGVLDMPANFRLSLIGHFDSPLAGNLTLPVTGLGGGIYQTDLTGDGTGDGSFSSNGGLGDLLPGTKLGSFGRDVNVSDLNRLISRFNTTMVGTPTPAGQVLLAHGFTQADLTALQAVIGPGPIAVAPQGAVGQAWLKTFDLGLNWGYKIKDRVELRPGVTFYNVFNFANFDGPAAPFTSVLNGGPGSPNGTTSPQPAALRLGLGSGVNALGAPRVVEFELKLNF
jgi:hypothetical protein